ncbi:MAG: BCCT family transporter [Lachnospiraceae bacterium]|nr:BCCT family transporter [Lachnospiraceae bacterium]
MKKDKKLRWEVLFPAWIIVISVLILNLVNYEMFLSVINQVIGWILKNFAWMFNLISLAALFLVIAAYFSPIHKIKIGGSDAKPIIGYKNYVWIVLCTIMGAGLMFWACAEPILHISNPPANVTAGALSGEAILWAMETILLEWTFTPMAIYAMPAVLFALVFYNMKRKFSIGSMLYPVFGDRLSAKHDSIIDCICLFCLCLGISSSLGSGVLLIVEGISRMTGGKIEASPVSWAVCSVLIMLCLIISSVRGLHKGLNYLSRFNSWCYLVIGIFVFLTGPTAYILNLGVESIGAYAADFFKISLWTSAAWGDGWSLWWPQFYWCIWLTWMPISAVFLGKISKGYTIRQVLNAIFVIPAVFSVIWMVLFSASAIYFELNGAGIMQAMNASTTAAAAYAVLEHLPLNVIMVPVFLITAVASYVTSADSNTNAMASLCTRGLTEEDTEAPVFLKIFWGLTISVLCIVMLTAFNIDGMKMLADLGGFFAAFLMILFIIAFIRILKNPSKYKIE